MIKNWKTELNNEIKFGVVIMELSEEHDTLTINYQLQSWKFMV